MTQKRRKADSGKAIGETTALRWEPTHVTKPNPRVVPLHILYKRKSIAKQCMVRRTKRHNKRERERKECQKNIQNPKRSVAEY